MSRPIGDIVDSLGVKLLVLEGDLISDVMVIAKICEADGSVRLETGWSDGMSWIERLGMVTGAQAMEMPDPSDAVDVEDDS